MKKIIFIANWTQGCELSGGDRIWIEFAKAWKNKLNITVIGSVEAIKISERYGLNDVMFLCSSDEIRSKNNLGVFSMLGNTLIRAVKGVRFIRSNSSGIDPETKAVYSTSDFLADSLLALYLKIKNPKIVWIAGFYLFAPKPWVKGTPYKGINFFKGCLFYLSQLLIYWYINRFADYVFVTSDPDVVRFITKRRDMSRVIVIKGGVDTTESERYLGSPDSNNRIYSYDACFLGRFHYQKGLLELIDIWKIVTKQKVNAKLAIIGSGPLEEKIKQKIKDLNLGMNIDLLGFLDGQPKFEIFKKSKIVLHPATYDSGGMAAAEAMAWGLPGISFDLEALKTYYPKGFLKASCFDLQGFADNIIKLLDDKALYQRLSQDAITLTRQWDWKIRANQVIEYIDLDKE